MPRLSITEDAREDLRLISDFISERSGSEDIAEDFVAKLVARCARLADLPGTFGTARPDLRSDLRSVSHKSYLIFFRYTDDVLEIVNVLHGSRDVIAYYRADGPDAD